MFKNCSIMVIRADDPSQILRLEVDKATQQAVCKTLSASVADLVKDKTRIPFDGSYKPNDDEFLSVENFTLPDEIKEAIRNPMGVMAYKKEDGEFPEIKAVFVGERIERNGTEKFRVAFQRFRKEQYMSTRGFNLYFAGNTFRCESNFGINISERIDCYYTKGELQFSSFFFARQIFDLSEYYRSATDQEVDAFASSKLLSIAQPQEFKNMANTWVRRKIAMINDSGVLKDNSAAKIQKSAKSVGIKIDVEDKKIVIPEDKEQMKIVLGFLDEEVYKGPFSKATLLANSKRPVKKQI